MEDGRTVTDQGLFQLLALAISLGIAILGGLIVGFLVSNCCPIDHHFDDEEHYLEVEYDVPLEDDDSVKGN
jgi:hypothetical protein